MAVRRRLPPSDKVGSRPNGHVSSTPGPRPPRRPRAAPPKNAIASTPQRAAPPPPPGPPPPAAPSPLKSLVLYRQPLHLYVGLGNNCPPLVVQADTLII